MTNPANGPDLEKSQQRILVIDDDLELCQVIVDTLRENGYKAIFAQTTEEGFDRAIKDPPNLILTDLEIPQMGGFVLCKKLRAHPVTRNIPIIFITVRDSQIDQQTAFSLGANQYITKPFRRSFLLKVVAELIESSKPNDWIYPEEQAQEPSPAEESEMFEADVDESKASQNIKDMIKKEADVNGKAGPATNQKDQGQKNQEDALIEKKLKEKALKNSVDEKTPLAKPLTSQATAKKPDPQKASKPLVPGKGAAQPAKPAPLASVLKKNAPPKPPLAPLPAAKSGPKERKSFIGLIGSLISGHKIIFSILLLLILGGAGFGGFKFYKNFTSIRDKVKKASESQAPAVAVNVKAVHPAPFQDILSAVGTVAGGSEIELRFQTEGNLRSLNFTEGQAIKSGDVIAQLDQTQAQIKLEKAKSEYYRYEKLYALGGVAKSAIEESKLQMQFAQSELSKTVLRASQAGIFGDKNVEVGEFITPQKRVGTLVSLDSVIIKVGVIEKEINKVFPGQAVVAVVDTYQGVEFKGKVENISPLVQGQSKTLTVEARFPNDGKLLLPGMFARTKIVIHEEDSVIAVPNDSLEKTAEGYQLYIVSQDNKAEARPVEVAYVSLTHSVISSGLEPGDQVIIQKPQELEAGSLVKVVEVENGISDVKSDLKGESREEPKP